MHRGRRRPRISSHVIFCNDVFSIPPVKTFLTYYRDYFISLSDKPKAELDVFVKKGIGAFWGMVFKTVLKYQEQKSVSVSMYDYFIVKTASCFSSPIEKFKLEWWQWEQMDEDKCEIIKLITEQLKTPTYKNHQYTGTYRWMSLVQRKRAKQILLIWGAQSAAGLMWWILYMSNCDWERHHLYPTKKVDRIVGFNEYKQTTI